MTDFVSCEWCGSDNWEEYELDNGKCKICVVNDCRHTNTNMVSYDLCYDEYGGFEDAGRYSKFWK